MAWDVGCVNILGNIFPSLELGVVNLPRNLGLLTVPWSCTYPGWTAAGGQAL